MGVFPCCCAFFRENVYFFIYLQCSARGAHSRERTSARPPLGRAAALPHGAGPPEPRDVQPAREKTARPTPARPRQPVHDSPPTVRLPTIHNIVTILKQQCSYRRHHPPRRLYMTLAR